MAVPGDYDKQAMLDVLKAIGLKPFDICSGSLTVDEATGRVTVEEMIRDDEGGVQPAADGQAQRIRRTYQLPGTVTLIREERVNA